MIPSFIVIDANLLILLLVGLYNENQIKAFKRTANFTVKDYEVIKFYFNNAEKVYITPHILTEVSNLTDRYWNNYNLFNTFKALTKSQIEVYIPKEKLLGFQFLPQIGIADSSLYFAAKETNSVVITDDEECVPYLESLDCKVLRFSVIQKLMRG
ncbi:MAG: hypothetical protein A2Y33_14465 [Spirochaetes bacterium GWF1_51_8]|nr:MAG: hypothetical protein A2Y33_14465 [Spirochaetes bacterium GWF1_51_8]